MKAAFIGNAQNIARVYGCGRKQQVAKAFTLHPDVLPANIEQADPEVLAQTECLFSTWGMPRFADTELRAFKALKAVFYAAGSVQSFARPFLEAGIPVISAWAANAIPVAEYTVANIILANKGVLAFSRNLHTQQDWRQQKQQPFPGNFETTVSLLGAGMIGKAVIARLQPYRLHILVFDPFLSAEKARQLGVQKVELADAFARGMVVSNHLANLPETRGMLRAEHFRSMPTHSTFLNSGRGATVDENGLIEVLQKRSDLTAILDVTAPEPPAENSPLYSLPNVFLTPHIAGSTSNEVWRMADTAIEEAIAFRDGRALRYAVSLDMLQTMA